MSTFDGPGLSLKLSAQKIGKKGRWEHTKPGNLKQDHGGEKTLYWPKLRVKRERGKRKE